MIYVLVFVMALGSTSQTGFASVNQEFNTQTACNAASSALIDMAQKRGGFVLTYGCFAK